MGAPHILTYNTGWGARHTGTGDGPQALLDYGLPAALGCTAEPLAITPTIQPAESVQTFSPQSLPIIAELNTQLSAAVAQTLRNKQRALVLGGDHSCAIGTWSGAAQALNARSNFGLIWIDAHMDAHTPQTRHEGAWGGHWHGQPLACLLGAGEPALTRIGGNRAKLNPAHVTLIGIRSYEPGEKAFLEKMNVRIAYMEEVQQRGFAAVFAEALQRAEQAAGGFGVTIDLDAFCPQDAPGVGTPEQGGLRAAEVLPGY